MMPFPESFPVPLIYIEETDSTNHYLNDLARELGTTLADRMMQKITHEETHSRNLIIPARLIAAK